MISDNSADCLSSTIAGRDAGVIFVLTPQHIWLAQEPVDMRRGIDTLTQYITDHLQQPWQGEAAFIFCNKSRSRIKVLRWDKHGVWLCLHRLHQGHCIWPTQGEVVWMLSPEQAGRLATGRGPGFNRPEITKIELNILIIITM